MNYKKQILELTNMKNLLELNNIKLSNKVDNRNINYYDRTDKWKSSEKGIEYDLKTDYLNNEYNIVDEVILSLNNAIEDLTQIDEINIKY